MMSNMNKIHSKKVLGGMRLLVLSLSSLLFASCYDDKGNYDYIDLEKVEIESPGERILDRYVISRFDTLTIDPIVTYQGKQVVGDEAPLDYLWTLYTTASGAGVDYTIDTLATTRKLEAQITRGGGAYHLQLTVRNRNDGVEYYMGTSVTIEESISAGWILLYECADAPGQSDVGLVVNEWTKRSIIKNREFWDLYKASNNTHMNGAPVTMLHTCANLAQGDIIMLFTDKEYAGVSHTTFEKNTAFENLFYEVPSKYDVTYYGPAGSTAMGETIINDNKVYVTSFMGGRSNFFGVSMSGNYGKLAPWASAVRAASFDAVVYDQTNQRFLVAPRGGVSFMSFGPQDPNAAFDVNNVGMELLMGDWGGNTNYYDYLLMKKGSEYYLAEANFGMRSNINLPNIGMGLHNITNSPGISTATSMAAAYLGQYIVYSSGNKVYNLAYNQSTTATTLWTAPEVGEEVTCVRLQKYYYMMLHQRILPSANQLMHIATWNENTKQGKLYEYQVNPASGAILGEPKVYNVPGKVKEMCWKYAMEM